MSTLLYATLTNRREAASAGTSDKADAVDPANAAAGKPGVTMWVDAAAALVPAEVLAAQAFLIGFVTGQVRLPLVSSEPVTVITNAADARALFWILLVAALAIYVIANFGHWSATDFLRMLIPPAAFVLWSMLQPGAAFDAVAHVSEFWRHLTGVVGVIVLAPLAKRLAYSADQATPPSVQAPAPSGGNAVPTPPASVGG